MSRLVAAIALLPCLHCLPAFPQDSGDLRSIEAQSSFQIGFNLDWTPAHPTVDLTARSSNSTHCRFDVAENDGSAIQKEVVLLANEPLFLVHIRSLDPATQTEISGIRADRDPVLTFRSGGDVNHRFQMICHTEGTPTEILKIPALNDALGGNLVVQSPQDPKYVPYDYLLAKLNGKPIQEAFRKILIHGMNRVLVEGCADNPNCLDEESHQRQLYARISILETMLDWPAYLTPKNPILVNERYDIIFKDVQKKLVETYFRMTSFQGADR